MQKVSLIAILITTLFFSCRKDSISGDCSGLKEGIIENDVTKVKTAITSFIATSPNKDYNESNIYKLCQMISSSCDISAEPYCFDCIQTLPSQTEIRISFDSGGTLKAKIIDLSYSPSNKISFRDMHD